MNVIKAYLLQPIVCTKLKYEASKAGNGFSVVRHVVLHDMLDQVEDAFHENQANDELIDEKIKDGLKLIYHYRNFSDISSPLATLPIEHGPRI